MNTIELNRIFKLFMNTIFEYSNNYYDSKNIWISRSSVLGYTIIFNYDNKIQYPELFTDSELLMNDMFGMRFHYIDTFDGHNKYITKLFKKHYFMTHVKQQIHLFKIKNIFNTFNITQEKKLLDLEECFLRYITSIEAREFKKF